MIFAKNDPQILEAVEEGDHLQVLYGQDISEHLKMCRELREHDEQNGMSRERHFQHLSSVPEIVANIVLKTNPEVYEDKTGKAHLKWLNTEVGSLFRVSKSAKSVKGEGLQILIK